MLLLHPLALSFNKMWATLPHECRILRKGVGYETIQSFRFAFFQFIFILMSRVGENGPITESDIKLVWSELRAPSELAILSGLTVLEMCLVIACKHLQVRKRSFFIC